MRRVAHNRKDVSIPQIHVDDSYDVDADTDIGESARNADSST